MQVQYIKEYSNCLDREMEYKIYGQGGKLCLAIPSQNGRFFEWEDRGMIHEVSKWIEANQLTIVTCDTLDTETWSYPYNTKVRMLKHELWFEYTIAYVCAIVGGIANSFLDTGIYPAVAEAISDAPGVATMGIKFFISVSQMFLPFFLGMAVSTTATGATSYNRLFWVCGIAYLVLAALILFCSMPDTDSANGEKKQGLIASMKETHFSIESIAMILIGFTCTGTFQLWLNCAQNFAKDVAGWADPSAMQTYYSMGTMIALVVTSFLTRKIKDVRFILAYPAICLAMLIIVLVAPSQTMCTIGAFVIGWAGAGGLLQIATSVCNMIFPKIKGTVTALVMIASSLCNYTILTAAGNMTPSGVMTMNIVLTAVGVLLGLYVNLRYKNLVAQD